MVIWIDPYSVTYRTNCKTIKTIYAAPESLYYSFLDSTNPFIKNHLVGETALACAVEEWK